MEKIPLVQYDGILSELKSTDTIKITGATFRSTTVTVSFTNEDNYIELTINDNAIKTTNIILCSFVGDEEIAIQNIVCGLKKDSIIENTSYTIFAGTQFGATGSYTINIIII